MLAKSLMISFIILVALGPQTAASKLTLDVWGPIRTKLGSYKRFSGELDVFFDTLVNAETFKSYPAKRFLGAGTGGVVFDIESPDDNLVAKVLTNENKYFQTCQDNMILHTLSKQKVSYTNKLVEIEGYTGTYKNYAKGGDNNFYVCILVLEKADTDLKIGKLFETKSTKNWPVLLRFFGKLIQSFAEINFKGKILHGDIKPENIMAKISKKGTPAELDVEPVVIDFDLNLENPEEEDMSDRQLRYTHDYRPKEMFELTYIPDIDPSDAWKKKWRNYKYSGKFLEDSYALGVTIAHILKIQASSNNVDLESKEYHELVALVSEMIGPKETAGRASPPAGGRGATQQFRPNTKVVLERFLEIIKACEKCSESNLTKAFVDEAQKSLDEMNTKLIKI